VLHSVTEVYPQLSIDLPDVFPGETAQLTRGHGYIPTAALSMEATPNGWFIVEKPIKIDYLGVPSGRRLHNYGKSPFLMGKSTINGHFQ